jgi:UDP-N-acetylmuramyl tripeptide synthase
MHIHRMALEQVLADLAFALPLAGYGVYSVVAADRDRGKRPDMGASRRASGR